MFCHEYAVMIDIRAAHPMTFSLEFFRRVVILMYLGMLNPKIATKKLCKIWNNWLGGAKKLFWRQKNHFFNIFLNCVRSPNNLCFFH